VERGKTSFTASRLLELSAAEEGKEKRDYLFGRGN